MGKKFSIPEQKQIRQRLITIFEEKMRTGNPSKITIDSLAQEATIAKGSFYHFYPSKEMLFVDVINQEQERLIKQARKIAEAKDTSEKDKLKKILLIILKEVQAHPWLENLSEPEFEKMVGRLPKEFRDNLLKEDRLAIQKLLGDLNLDTKVPVDDLLVIIEIILSSASHASDYGHHYESASKTMINCLVDNLFKELNTPTTL
ncbi:TetR/AcrR family transcriptional regulator [Streptococcus sobrinus]|uniref:TetR/AcrR family transcriptional regulator n=1 Tax=Streptococcus sobrinus TaxID=1310 RepID=UPI000D707EC2|nr:TetR/AcrR family transcriptional regulator [Streptococcus sobrinus]AWN61230.1 TetR/AcrR family transcriptional regulator [Streptococcus sobrinus]